MHQSTANFSAFETNYDNSEKTTCYIYDALGRLLNTLKDVEYDLQDRLSRLPSGMYFIVQKQQETQQRSQYKFIKP